MITLSLEPVTKKPVMTNEEITAFINSMINEFVLLSKLMDHDASVQPRYYQLKAELTRYLGDGHPVIQQARIADNARTVQHDLEDADFNQERCNKVTEELLAAFKDIDNSLSITIFSNVLINLVHKHHWIEGRSKFGEKLLALLEECKV